MRCLFCKRSSDASRSVEHVIPESLGNHALVLPVGVVCDGCNNYFSRKVEAPFLNGYLVRLLRFYDGLPSKRGRVPPMLVASPQLGRGEIHRSPDGPPSTVVFEDSSLLDKNMFSRQGFVTYTPMIPPSESTTSRFLAKIAVGYLAHLLVTSGRSADVVVHDEGLDRIRNHARRGTDPNWPVMARAIYSPDHTWLDPDESEPYQKVTEVDLFEHDDDLFLVFAAYGTELTILLNEPRIDSYERWLASHGGASPLYPGASAADLRWTDQGPYPRPGWSLPPT